MVIKAALPNLLVACALWTGLALPETYAQQVTASLERNPIRADETVRLVLEADQGRISSGPDLTPLERDFEVLGMSTSTQIQFVNGQQSTSTRWVVELAPRRAGELRVPAIALGQVRTEPLALTVIESETAGGDPDGDIFLEAQVHPRSPYVQSQVTYMIRLYRAVEILDGTLQEPHAEKALVQRLGRDIGYAVTRHGRRYRVIERRYAIFPQSSGELLLPPVRFDGEVASAGAGGSTFSRLFTRGRRVRLSTEAFRLDVRPQPAHFQGRTWLPARGFHLIEQWSEDPPAPQVGEPITRTLIVKAAGLRGEQLPELEVIGGDALKLYPDQPSTRTSSDAEAVYGQREQRFALVPTRAGDIELAEIRVAWWDTQNDIAREAVIPARTLAVTAAPADATGVVAALTALDAQPDAVPSVTSPPRRWQVASGFLLLLWAMTAFGWWRATRGMVRAKPDRNGEPKLAAARGELRTACAASEPLRAKDALLRWAGARWPENPPFALPALASRLEHPPLSAEILNLDRALYSQGGHPWQGASLSEAAKIGLRQPRSAANQHQALPELYPAH